MNFKKDGTQFVALVFSFFTLQAQLPSRSFTVDTLSIRPSYSSAAIRASFRREGILSWRGMATPRRMEREGLETGADLILI